MNFKKMMKQTVVLSLSASLLVSGGASALAKGNNHKDAGETYGFSHITRADMLKIPAQQNSEQFKVPEFDASTIQNIPSAVKYDENGNKIEMDVWDSWPLQNADGTVANYKGYEIVFALAGDPKRGSDTFIYLFYKKAGETSLSSWKNAGRVFKDSDKLVPGDTLLNDQAEEWSGSATLTSDGKIRLFYTNRQAWDPANDFYGKQILTTAQVNVSAPNKNTLKIDGVEDLKSIYDGKDGEIYQNVESTGFSQGDYNDNHTLRDPHYVEDKGRKYLVFEANTGKKTGYQGAESLNNPAYYGGTKAFFEAERKKLLESPVRTFAEIANGALGIIELNDDYTFKKELKPLIASNTVTDEIERPNVFKLKGKWYLFTSSRGSKMYIDGIDDEDIYLLGYVSNSLTGPYKPLNGTGLVLHQDLDPTDITWTYAHFAIPQVKGDNVVITSYMTNRGMFDDQHSTFAPSFLMNIKNSTTSVVKDSILEQGQITISTKNSNKPNKPNNSNKPNHSNNSNNSNKPNKKEI
ncbi:glycoside hydrolase family 68 protein [Paenibacillus gallinarum]|uniref:Glycoside hydrolase family 68 protein n=1 Tax=Paenibacillus gallinarum TaxID=2762232 RepID=A0ABR8T3G3_9BACL|nr:glycoside hydrolase family 68 protein [Paenibacillus gallinarum]MBD7970114.1 glycoside hydrolase family 68 protein [Paenibacillus gallinarum]